ncbi:MAG: heme-copper oxidase subunit III [Anaeromyxobacteraceae bacterium]
MSDPGRRVLDVSDLPTHAFAPRDPMMWGALGLVAIESTMFALCWASLLYLRGNFVPYPPTALPRSIAVSGAIEVLLLLATLPPTHWMNGAAEAGKLRPMRRAVTLSVALQGATLLVRAWTLGHLPFRWDTHAHGSMVWLTAGMHTVHLVTGFVEEAVLLVLLFKGPVLEKHQTDIHTTGYYWYFVVAWWIPTYLLLYVDPLLFPRTGLP